MPRPDEGLIHAWLDGELEPTEAARVQKFAETDPEWTAAVAEARGLIAASSRIVRALDAVPGGVVPSRSVRAPMAARGFRVRPWMGIAAGLVLVVGTAYVMRESTEQAFGPTADPGASAAVESALPQPTVQPAVPANAPQTATANAPAAAPPDRSAPAGGERREAAAPLRDQPIGPLRQTADDARRDAAGAGSASALPPAAAPPPAPPTATAKSAAERSAEEDRSLSRMRSGSNRLSQVVVTGVAEAAAPAASPTATLAGCWRVSAPDSLAALYRDLAIVRSAGDTLEVLLPNTRTVLVIRDRDTLRGGLTAVREVCPPRP